MTRFGRSLTCHTAAACLATTAVAEAEAPRLPA